MGVFKAVTMYRTDTGRELAVQEMETTHLMNAINHHKRQCDLISDMIHKRSANHMDLGYLKSRQADLEETIIILEEELTFRDPDEERETGARQDFRPSKKHAAWFDERD